MDPPEDEVGHQPELENQIKDAHVGEQVRGRPDHSVEKHVHQHEPHPRSAPPRESPPVLAQRLENPPAPAVALLDEGQELLRRLRAGDGVDLIDDLPSVREQAEGQVAVFREGVVGVHPGLLHRLAPEEAERTRHDSHAAEEPENAPHEVLADDVFERLEIGKDPVPVEHLDVSGHRPDGRILHVAHGVVERIGIEAAVRVHTQQKVPPRLADSVVQGVPLAPVRNPVYPDPAAAFLLRHLRGHLGRPVGGSIIDHNHFEGGVVDPQMGADRLGDDLLLVVGRHDDRDERGRIRLPAPAPPFAGEPPPIDDQVDHHENREEEHPQDQDRDEPDDEQKSPGGQPFRPIVVRSLHEQPDRESKESQKEKESSE